MPNYRRFVAMGDSQTEGLWDGDDKSGLRGWADRFADLLVNDSPDLLYANLAVRGRRIAEVRDEQLEIALAMQPDLVGICIGMNDVTRIGSDLEDALDLMEDCYARLTATGATVMTTIFPDVRRIVPIAKSLGPRVDQVNERIRECGQKYGLRLVDLYDAPVMTDLRMWSPDRVHGSSLGHERFALAAAEAAGLPGFDHTWAQELDDRPAESRAGGSAPRSSGWAPSSAHGSGGACGASRRGMAEQRDGPN
ncbi:SGNH/GDSL hydrolase family protein [Antrihabitans cavernicola]|uniref:SGNH/GDSL hydrolase family protein n=1 Tax=Antrihabitans cavernicola TaxID=2495913 RepID=UPI00338EF36A